MIRNFTTNQIQLSYELRRQTRKSLSIHIVPGGQVIVKAPLHLSEAQITEFIQQKLRWIISKRQLLSSAPPFDNSHWQPEQRFWFLGTDYPVKIVLFPIRCQITQEADYLLVQTSKVQNQHFIIKELQHWLDTQISRIFPQRLHDVQQQYFPEIPPPSLNWRQMQRRWGSYCSSQHHITLNKSLITRPLTCIDYVLVHEFCHYYHHYHDAAFYHLLSSKIANWKELRGIMHYGLK